MRFYPVTSCQSLSELCSPIKCKAPSALPFHYGGGSPLRCWREVTAVDFIHQPFLCSQSLPLVMGSGVAAAKSQAKGGSAAQSCGFLNGGNFPVRRTFLGGLHLLRKPAFSFPGRCLRSHFCQQSPLRASLVKVSQEGGADLSSGVPLGASCVTMKGLWVRRALGAAAAFESHAKRQSRSVLNAMRESALEPPAVQSTAPDPPPGIKHSIRDPVPTRPSNSIWRRNTSQSSGVPAVRLSKDRTEVSICRAEAYLKTGSAERNVPGSERVTATTINSKERSLPPLAVTEKLLTDRGGSPSLPLFKQEGQRSGTGLGRSWGDRPPQVSPPPPEMAKATSRKPADPAGGKDVQHPLLEKGIILPKYDAGAYRIVCPKVTCASDLQQFCVFGSFSTR